MAKYLLFTVTFAAHTHSQSIFYGNDFICDPAAATNLNCKPGDNLICDPNQACTLTCASGCNGVIINAKRAQSLSITNCIHCDAMTIYCPQNTVSDNLCTLELSNHIQNTHIYAQESFDDFHIVPTHFTWADSALHCGDLTYIEFMCALSENGQNCVNPATDVCQSYRMPTVTPTPTPTLSTLTPTLTPEKEHIIDSIHSTEMTIDGVNGSVLSDNGHGSGSSNAHYIMLIVGLCIIWGSFFCCFIIMYYHREKKQQLNKAVHIMSRPMTPSNVVSKTVTQLKLARNVSKTMTVTTHNPREHSVSSEAPKHRLKLQLTTTNEVPNEVSRTHTEANELYKVTGVNNIISLNLSNQKKREIEMSENKREMSHSQSNGNRLSPRMDFIRSPRLSPRPYFYDKHSGNITPHHAMSPRKGRLVLNDYISNAMSNGTVNTAEAVEIKLPFEVVKEIPNYDIKIEEDLDDEEDNKHMHTIVIKRIDAHSQVEESHNEEEIINSHKQTPQFEDDDMHLNINRKAREDEEEGSLDSRYKLHKIIISNDNDREELKELEDNGHGSNHSIIIRDENDSGDDLQTEGDENKSVNNEVSPSPKMNKMSVLFWEYSECPPPPPNSLYNNANHSYINSMASHSLSHANLQSQMSPSRHYRVKYSLGIQQDIKNCMSVPGAVAEKKKFAFDDKSVSEAQSQSHHSHSQQHSLLKPPISPSYKSNAYQNHHSRYGYNNAHSAHSAQPTPPISSISPVYYSQNASATPQPMPQLTYLNFPQNRPRIYSDPSAFVTKQSL